MNACLEFEDRLLDYESLEAGDRAVVDQHLSTCEACRQFQAALTTIDQSFEMALSGLQPSADLARVVVRNARKLQPPQRPSFWPEVFDGIGWLSVMAIVVWTSVVLVPREFQELAVWVAAAATIAAGSSWFGIRSWRELGN